MDENDLYIQNGKEQAGAYANKKNVDERLSGLDSECLMQRNIMGGLLVDSSVMCSGAEHALG